MRISVRLARITAFRLVVRDGEASARFYAALGFAAGDEGAIDPDEMGLMGIAGRGWRRPLRLGAARVDLDRFEYPGAIYAAATGAASRCFQHLALVCDDVAALWAKARAAGATAIGDDAPVTLPPSSGGVTAIKCRDVEGHPLEFIHFPDRAPAGPGVSGIDHSALVVSDLAMSQAFYQRHGLTVGKTSLNRGSSQARLDGLDGPVVDVVPMDPAQTPPHVELLHYREPAAAPCPAWGPADSVATRIVWACDSPALLRDPDGHLHQVEASGGKV